MPNEKIIARFDGLDRSVLFVNRGTEYAIWFVGKDGERYAGTYTWNRQIAFQAYQDRCNRLAW